MFALRRSFTLAQPRAATALVSTNFASFSNSIKDKQKGEEKSYFSKQDAKLLKALVEKMEKREEDNSAEAEHDCMVDDLTDIFGRHGLDKNGKNGLLWQELLEWKRHKY